MKGKRMSNYKTDVTIVLPSLNPDEKFLGVVKGLVEEGFADIVIVNDGSDADHVTWFEQAAAMPGTHVLVHEVNKGKGRALKDAFAFVAEHRPNSKGVVTIDGDGQHLRKDIVACAKVMLEHEDKVIMGCRDFNAPDIPARSRGGNKFTSRLFKYGCGIVLSDTQTGLRAIPKQYLKEFCDIKGERFEYETNMLLQMKRKGIEFVEVSIATVYEGENEGSHFHPLVDSYKIMKLIFIHMLGTFFRYMISAGTSFVLDLGIYYLALQFGKVSILAATVIARVISSFYNFNMNRKLVFKSEEGYGKTMVRYYALCVVQMLVSAGLVTLVKGFIPGGAGVATVIKAVVDTCLFVISYQIQKHWVFKK